MGMDKAELTNNNLYFALVFVILSFSAKQKASPDVWGEVLLCLRGRKLFLNVLANELFLNTCLLTSKAAEVVELRATYLTNLVDDDAVDVW